MATIEGLFNFDEKLLARQVAKDNYSAAIGRSAPAGWGPMMMGVDQIGNAIFNSDDKILKEQTIAQTSLKQVVEELGEDAKDNAKLYAALGQRLVENGASSQTIMKLKQVASNQANDQANVETANTLKKAAHDLAVDKHNKSMSKDQADRIDKRTAEFNSELSDEDSKVRKMYNQAMMGITKGDDSNNAVKAGQAFDEIIRKNYIHKGMTASEAIRLAKEEFDATWHFKADDTFWYGSDDSEFSPQVKPEISEATSNALDKYKAK
jgi:hypothetical protein